MKRLGFLAFGILTSTQVFAMGGIEPTNLHGTRHNYLGGAQVGIEGDAYSVFYNPAGLVEAKSSEFVINSHNWFYTYEAPIGADNAQRKSERSWAPFFYLGGVKPLNKTVTLGFALFPSQAIGGTFKQVDYGPLLTDRTYENKLMRIEAAPTVAFNLNDNFSIGASWRVSYTEYKKAVGTFAGVNSARLDSTLYNWDFKGFKIGALLHDENFRFALTYRFPNPILLEGTTKIETALNVGTPAKVNTSQEVTIPQEIEAGISYYWLPGRFMTALSYVWMNSEDLEYDAPKLDPTSPYAAVFTPTALRTPLEWKNGHAIHLGSEYTFALAQSRKLRVGAGLAYDIAVGRDKNPNPVLAPSANYLGLCLGGQYESGSNVFGLAASYGQYGDHTDAAELNPEIVAKGIAFAGKYELKVFTMALDYKVRF